MGSKRELKPKTMSLTGSYIRLWLDILDNPKVHDLDDDLFSGWIKILLAVKKHRKDGLLPGGKLIAFWTHQDGSTVARWLRTSRVVGSSIATMTDSSVSMNGLNGSGRQ